MKHSLVLLSAVITCLATGNTAVVPNGGASTNIQGPSSESRIVGPDGSVITAQAPGGQIIHEETPGVFAPAGHFLGLASQITNPAAPGILAHKAVDTVISGSSDTIASGVDNGSHSVMGVVGTPSGYIASLGVKGR